MRKSLIIPALVVAVAASGQANKVMIADFSAGSLEDWQVKSFKGETEYELVERNGRTVLRAHCDGTASGLYLEKDIDLTETPILHWSWRVEHVYEGLEEQTRAGDDYPARLYVVDDGGLLVWRTRAVNYVWSSSQPVGAHWPNAFAEQAMMVAVQSGPPDESGFVHESRDVREDFKRYFGREVDVIEAVALMTDCDNAGVEGMAWYGDIWFSAR